MKEFVSQVFAQGPGAAASGAVDCSALNKNEGFGTGVSSLKEIFADKDLFTNATDWCIIVKFIQAIIFIALDFFFVLAVIMILYGSLTYITSNGETSKADNGKKTIFWAIAATVVISSARLIVTLVDNYIRDARP